MFSPVKASQSIKDTYKRYLGTIFHLNDRDYDRQFRELLSKDSTFAAGPFLDVSDSFTTGRSISELVAEGMLPKGMLRVGMPAERPLYAHQERAILKALNGENIVVSTGTGSGKTESFLIPVLAGLLREHELGSLTPGVRALIVYPMNALANDQIERMRVLLKDVPEISYGAYTGQTKGNDRDALEEYRKLNNNALPQSNERISRAQMKQNPPHILITNYAMLEYLMVRPEDNVFFDGEYGARWKYIVMDEAHVYSGSTGIEVSMLLRRLKAKLGVPDLQFILTSATLGNEDQDDEVAEFASALCASKFRADNVVRAQREEPEKKRTTSRLSPKFYSQMAQAIREQANGVAAALMPGMEEKPLEEALYDRVLHDENYWEIRKLLADAPRSLRDIAEAMKWTQQNVEDFVTVASYCEQGHSKLFDARYHLFLRAADSVFITLPPNKRLFLTRETIHREMDGTEYCVFEIGACRFCGAIYLYGKVDMFDGRKYLRQCSFSQGADQRKAFLLSGEYSDTDDEHSLEKERIHTDAYELCPRCGFLRRAGTNRAHACEHDPALYVRVIQVSTSQEGHRLTKCIACENSSPFGIARMFFTGQEAVTSVLGTALYEALPAYRQIHQHIEENDDSGFGGFGFEGASAPSLRESQAKQFIAFSDNRQAAAYFATYFDLSYRSILYRRMVCRLAERLPDIAKGIPLTQFAEELAADFEADQIHGIDGSTYRKEAWKAILADVVDNNGNTSLSQMGLISFALDDAGIGANAKWHLTKDEVWDIVNVFALGMLADAAVFYEIPFSQAEREFFTHGGVEYGYTYSDSNEKQRRRSFIPSVSGRLNKRLDYLSRVMARKGLPKGAEELESGLKGIWRILIGNNYMALKEGEFRIHSSRILVRRPSRWYRCSSCHKLTPYNVASTCPSYRCDGTLSQVNPEELMKDNHYYRLYREMDVRELRVVEHTAQLDRETAYEYQKRFKNKELDVLSCSTTFEMGVDVGSLETVFMRNMPPSPANYAQRAGRAGRSRRSAAFALTFCTRANHDFAYFSSPQRIIRGLIRPPHFNVKNDRIAIRHVYAAALGMFWRLYPEYFDNAARMAQDGDDGTEAAGYAVFADYLRSKPEALKQYLKAFLPPSLTDRFGVERFAWCDGLVGGGGTGALDRAVAEYHRDVDTLNEMMNVALQKGYYGKASSLQGRIKVYRQENVLAFLSRKNVLPKYGFPVDTVELSFASHGDDRRIGLQLQRDLSMAISEYAPGSQVVANGNLITSRYIRKLPGLNWRRFDYAFCPDCKTLNTRHNGLDDEARGQWCCRACQTTFQERPKTFIIPEFGFEADANKVEKPGLTKPEHTYRGEIAYIGNPAEPEIRILDTGRARIELWMSHDDELAALNQSNFFVCEYCGFTELNDRDFGPFKLMQHHQPSGHPCAGSNKSMQRFSLGYVFRTDVLQIRFIDPCLREYDRALSVLYGLLRGISSYMNIELSDVAGCLQYVSSEGREGYYSLILYDRTPGGSGYVRQMNSENVMREVLKHSLSIMESCDCGGDVGDASCYTCLRSYSNQRIHDLLKRCYVIDFLKKVI